MLCKPETAHGMLRWMEIRCVLLRAPEGSIVFGGSGANRTVTVTPAANQNGLVTITVTVSDGQLSTSTGFQLTVTAVNDPPTITRSEERRVGEGTTSGRWSCEDGEGG